MTNPLSNEGVSDKDFAAAVGIAMGETGSKRISKEEMAAVIDVAMNRLEGFDKDRHRATERSLHGVITARGQFDASNPRGSIGGRQKYDAGYNAIMNGAPVPANMRTLYDTAVKQAIGVLSKDGPWRGTARNAEYFSSTAKKLSRSEARMHAKLGKGTGTKIGASTFYGPEHTKQFGKRDAPTPARREAEYSKFGQEGTPREKLSQPFASEDYSKFGPLGTPREAIAPTAAPYSPASLDIGPDFTSPPSQARGPVENPYEFSNINPNAEVAPGSFAGYGPNAFGAVDQAPVDYGTTYPELSAGLYSNEVAPPDVPAVPDIMGQFDPTNFMTEEQAIEHAGFAGQRPSENVEIRNRPYGETISEQIARNTATARANDFVAAVMSQNFAPVGAGPINQAALTSNPYASPDDLPSPPAPTTDLGIWGGTSKFNDTYNAASSRPSFQDYETRAPLAGLGVGGITSAGPIGMGTLAGVDVRRDLSGITAGMYPDPARGIDTAAVADAVRSAPYAGSTAPASGYSAGTGAQLGVPDFAALSALDREAAYQADVAAMRDPAATAARGAWSDQAEVGQRGFFSDTPWSGPGPAAQVASAAPEVSAPAPLQPDFNVTDILNETPWSGGYTPDVFQPSPLGLGQGIIDQGPYSSPIGGLSTSFSPANLGNPMPNSAVSTQAPAAVAAPQREIVGYETITKDVPNPAWSEWSKDYATRNASQEAWLAADEDKRAWDCAPPNPSALANTSWAFKEEPARTIAVEQQGKPIYSNPVVQAQPAVNVPAIQAQPRVAAAPAASIPAVNARPAQAPLTAAPVGVGGWWDSFTNGLGNILGGMSLANLGGDYAGYGQFGGAYDPGGYGGGYGGTAPGDAGYGSDARSGASNMGAGNLYQ